MDATHLVVIRNLATDVVRKVRIVLEEGVDLQQMIDYIWGRSEIIVAVPVEELTTA